MAENPYEGGWGDAFRSGHVVPGVCACIIYRDLTDLSAAIVPLVKGPFPRPRNAIWAGSADLGRTLRAALEAEGIPLVDGADPRDSGPGRRLEAEVAAASVADRVAKALAHKAVAHQEDVLVLLDGWLPDRSAASDDFFAKHAAIVANAVAEHGAMAAVVYEEQACPASALVSVMQMYPIVAAAGAVVHNADCLPPDRAAAANGKSECVRHMLRCLSGSPHEPEAHFRHLAENVSDMIWTMDLDLRLTYISPSAGRVLGYSPAEMMRLPLRRMLAPSAFKEAHRVLMEELRLEREPGRDPLRTRTLELEQVRKDKTRIWVEVHVSFLRDSRGQATGILGVTRDFTTRRRISEQLRESNEALEAIYRSSPAAIAVLDAELRVGRWNPAAERIFGWCERDVLGKPLAVLLADSESRIAGMLQQARDAEPLSAEPVSASRRNGSAIDLHLWAAPVRDPRTEAPGVVVLMADDTEHQRYELLLRQAYRMEGLGQLAAGVAHDFNNILTAIMGGAELLSAQVAPDSPLREGIDEIRRAAGQAATLTSRLLIFSREQEVKPQLLNLNQLVTDASALLRRTLGENIELRTDLDARARPVIVDPQQFEQVITSLAVNGREAMPRGGCLTISTRNTLLDEAQARLFVDLAPGFYVVLSVTDTGEGMDENARANAFEPFFATGSFEKKAGLGLFVAYGIVRKSGGHIAVESAPGLGTTMRVYLPAAPADTAVSSPGVQPTPAPHKARTVLVVEDEAMVRKPIARVLSLEGFRTLSAENGEQAIEIIEAEEGLIDLMITDVIMPGMNGRELAEKATARYPGIRTLFMSGHSNELLGNRVGKSAEAPFIQKPFSMKELLQRVHEILRTDETSSGP